LRGRKQKTEFRKPMFSLREEFKPQMHRLHGFEEGKEVI
jgi:hypothetical protein